MLDRVTGPSETAAIIFAGGQGERLWPLSRDRRPKQFQPVTGDDPLLTVTVNRLAQHIPVENIFVSTLHRFRDTAIECGNGVPEENFILERQGKGPATAYALALAEVHRKRGNVPVFTCPSDHMVDDERAFLAAVDRLLDGLAAEPGTAVVMAAEPTSPDKGLGYFSTVADEATGATRATTFIEKPDEDRARELIAGGDVLWNLACYAVHPELVLDAYRAVRPYVMSSVNRHIRSGVGTGYDGPAAGGHELHPLFEVGVRPRVVKGEFGWNDVGTWPRLEGLLTSQGVDSIGSSVTCDSDNVLSVSLDGRPVVTLGVQDLIIVTHEDAVYVLDKESAADRPALDRVRSTLAARRREDLL